MNFQIESDPQLPFILIRLSGRFDVADLEKCYTAIFRQSEWKEGTKILWDVRASSLAHLTQDDMRKIAAMTGKYKDRRGSGCAAWVTGRDVDFGMGRMYEMINEKNRNYTFRVFRTVKEAEDWILNTKC